MNETTKRNIINLVYDIRNNVLAYGMINSKRTTKNIQINKENVDP